MTGTEPPRSPGAGKTGGGGDARAAERDARWLDRARRALDKADLSPRAETHGRVVHVADSIVGIEGLSDVRLNELVRFEGGEMGMALTLDADTTSAILFDDTDAIEAGMRVSGTGEVARCPTAT